MNLSHLTDEALLKDTKRLAQRERELSIELLWHLKEIDDRKLYSDLKHPSLWAYVIKELGYSEGAAHRRIVAARALKSMPDLVKPLREGTLNLMTVATVVSEFKHEPPAVRREILKDLEQKTGQEIKQYIADRKNEPRVIFLKVDTETDGLLKNFRGLVPHEPEPLKLALREGIDRRQKQRVGHGIRREIFKRDRFCTNCGSEFSLEVDHILPKGLGGDNDLRNLRLLCRQCNQRAALRQGLGASRIPS